MNRSNVDCKGDDSWNRLYGYQVNAYHGAILSKWIKGSQFLYAPTIRLFTGIVLLTTWSHPPGAAHRSMQHRADSKKAYFLFSWMSLNAERARYPCSLQDMLKGL